MAAVTGSRHALALIVTRWLVERDSLLTNPVAPRTNGTRRGARRAGLSCAGLLLGDALVPAFGQTSEPAGRSPFAGITRIR